MVRCVWLILALFYFYLKYLLTVFYALYPKVRGSQRDPPKGKMQVCSVNLDDFLILKPFL